MKIQNISNACASTVLTASICCAINMLLLLLFNWISSLFVIHTICHQMGGEVLAWTAVRPIYNVRIITVKHNNVLDIPVSITAFSCE